MKTINSVYIFILAVCILLFACKNDAASSESSQGSDTKSHSVTIDQNGGIGLTQLVYPVKDGDTLKTGDLKGTSTIPYMLISSYTADDTSDFKLDSTPVLRDMKITANWSFDPVLNTECVNKTNAKSNLLVYAGTVGGDVLGVACAVQAKADVTARDSTLNFTPLLLAGLRGSLGSVQLLLKSGSKINEVDENNITVLSSAAQSGNLDLVTYLVSYGASVKDADTSGNTALIIAALKGNLEIVKFLLASGSSIAEKDTQYNRTVFLHAASSGNAELIQYLLETAGANINDIDESNRTALILAAQGGAYNAVKYLLSKGVNINDRDTFGESALMKAAASNSEVNSGDRLNTVKYLASYTGVDLTFRSTGIAFKGLTALGMAKAQLASPANTNNPIYTAIVDYLLNTAHAPE